MEPRPGFLNRLFNSKRSVDSGNLLDTLVRRSLLEWDVVSERFDVHDLVRVFATERLTDADAVRLRYAQHYARVAKTAGTDLYNQGGQSVMAGLALFDRERAHIDAGWAWAKARAGEAPADRLLCEYADATANMSDLRYDTRRERIPQYKTALEATRRRNDHRVECVVLYHLGMAHLQLHDTRRAIRYHEQLLALARKVGDRHSEAMALSGLGNVHQLLGEPRRAIEYHEQLLARARRSGNRQLEGAALGGLGNAHYILHDARRAIEYYEQWLGLAREVGDRQGEVSALGSLGNGYGDLGDVQRAIDFYHQQLTIERAIGDRANEARTCWNLGLCYERQGDWVRAVESMQRCVDFEREIGHPDASKDAAHVASLRQRIAAGEGTAPAP